MPTNSTEPKRNVVASILGLLGMSGIAGVLIAALITPVIAVAGVAANSSITLFETLPDYLEIQPLQQKTELYADRNGQREKIAEFYSQNRVEVELDQVSDYVEKAAISTEDPRFYEHGGVDVISAARAMVVGIIGDSGAGASTITMQYVRNQRVQAAEALLDPEERDKAYLEATETSIGRKLQEMRLAIGVEQQYDKKDILRGYLNIALFGGQVYGIESAAQYYFGKAAADLTLPESATLVGMVQDPNVYRIDDPENLEASTQRRNYVLRRMMEEHAITKAEYDEAVNTEITPKITPTKHGCMNAEENSQFFCDYVRKVILNDPAFGATYEERLFNFQTKGYQIDTTIDLDLQQKVTESLDANIPHEVDYMNLGAAVSMVQPGTGHVLAMQQNKEFDETDAAADSRSRTSVNYNTDFAYGGSTGFQVGSTYKVFTLANWLQSGHSLYESIPSQTRSFNLANFQDSCNGAGGGSWSPQNDYNAKFGSVNAVEATVQSINTSFVAMAEQLDQCTTRDIAMGLGAHRADGQPNETYPSAVLGTDTIAPLSMATAFAGIANDGKSCSPIAIKGITLRDGTKIDPPKSDCKQVIDPNVARAMAVAMGGVMTRGAGTATNPGLGTIIGKTGTTDDAYDTWIVAATTGVAGAVWVGNEQAFVYGDGSASKISLRDAGLAEARHAIGNGIFSAAIPEYGAKDIPAPTGDAVKVENATVPDVKGMSIDAATAAIEGAGFTVAVGEQVNSDVPAGSVARTNPSANTRTPKGSTITIHPSNGKDDKKKKPEQAGVVMPELSGMSYDQAIDALSKAGLGNANNTFSWHGPKGGKVSRTEPASGSTVPPNSEIKIYAN
ncbi:transglycosylase domain-containing protein [Gulosibacter bifidus]|uniref:Transglycosylase domain-containing protein n=1 Tax=Gulosibacter bifidus TaxID=272239 RepID=A0ABW5RL53_9MICO|nr:transglycosylase domain-containing protein [Gulosibacter bifidus]